MKEAYHKQKLLEYALAHAPEMQTAAAENKERITALEKTLAALEKTLIALISSNNEVD